MHIGKYGRKSRGSNLFGVIPLAAGIGVLKLVGDYSPSGFEHLWNTNELGFPGTTVVIGLAAGLGLVAWGLAVLFGENR